MRDPRPQVPLLRSLEGLRLISSIGIVSVHMLPHAGLSPPPGFDLFVDLFFVISGIVIGNLYTGAIHGWGDYGTFLRRRLARLYPLHLATLLFYIAIGWGVAHYHLRVDDPARFDPAQIVPNLLLVHAWFPGGRLSYNFVSWSISAEFFAYLVFPLVAWVVTRRFGFGLALVAALLALCILIAERMLHTPLYTLKWNCAPPRALPSFAFGVWLSAFGGRIGARVGEGALRSATPALALALAIGFAVGLSGYGLLAIIYALVSCAYLADLKGVATLAAWRPLSANGHLTYSLYMLHVPVATVFLSFVFPRLLGSSALAQAIGVGLAMLILIAAGAASFRWLENPLRRLLR